MRFKVGSIEQNEAGVVVRGQFATHLSVIIPHGGTAHVKASVSGMQDEPLSASIAAAVANAVHLAPDAGKLEGQGIPVEQPDRSAPGTADVKSDATPDTDADDEGPTIAPEVTGDVQLRARAVASLPPVNVEADAARSAVVAAPPAPVPPSAPLPPVPAAPVVPAKPMAAAPAA